MKPLIFYSFTASLTGCCTITLDKRRSAASQPDKRHRACLTYNQPLFLLHGRVIMYLTGPQRGECQQMGYAVPAVSCGQ